MFEKNFTNNDLCQVEKELNELRPIVSFYLSQKDRDVKRKLENLLNDEKEIISKQISSTDKKECEKLYADFLGKEKFIYEMYELMGENNRKASGCGEYIKNHLINAMKYDFRCILSFCIRRKIFSALSFVLLGALLCVPYSIAIGKTIEISLGNIPFSMIKAFVMGIVYTVVCLLFCFLQNLFLFRVSYCSPSWLKWLYILISASYIVLIYFLLKISTSYFEYFYYLHILLMALVFLMMYKYGNKNFEEFIFAFLLIMTIDSFIPISHIVAIVVYYEYDTAHTVIITALAALMFVAGFLSLSNHLDYKTSLIINGIWIRFSVIFLSGLFVRIAGIGNYQTDLDIKKENIPGYINLENIKCKNKPNEDINFIKYTCISDKMPSSTVNFKNILVKVKSDGRYWLEVVAKDQNKSKIDDYRFWISEKNVIN